MTVNTYRNEYKIGQEFVRYLASDIHIGHSNFDKKLFTKEFDRAKELEATIDINGDVIDLILPKDMKRYTASGDTVGVDSHVNTIIDRAVDLLTPYADNLRVIGHGNHEVSAVKFNGIDALKIIVHYLNKERNPKLKPIKLGGYQGFIREKFFRVSNGKSGGVKTFDIFYNHGQGGKAEVSKGSIDLERRKNIDSDVVWLGHKHTMKMEALDPILGLSVNDTPKIRDKIGIITGCFLKSIKEYDIEKDGYTIDYSTERFRTLTAYGGVLLHLTVGRDNINVDFTFTRTL